MSETIYECRNKRCDLGSRHDPGYFTGGITPEHALNLTGDPEAPSGEGICPNCGEPGTDTGTKHESIVATEED